MSAICMKCKEAINPDVIVYDCDLCKRSVHGTCSEISASEAKCMQLVKKRVLVFLCCYCEDKLKLRQEIRNKKQRSESVSSLALDDPVQRNLPSDDRMMDFYNSINECKTLIEQMQNDIITLKESNIQLIHMLTTLAPVSNTNMGVSKETTTTTATNGKSTMKSNARGMICRGTTTSLKVANANIGERLAKLSWIYLSNLDVNTTPDNIIEALDQNFKHLYKCEKLPSKFKNPRSAAFKLGVPEQFENKYLSVDFWPDGCFVGKYNPPRKAVNRNVGRNNQDNHNQRRFRSAPNRYWNRY